MKKISRFSVLRVENQDLVPEAPPRVDNYRNVLSIHGRVARPTLEELHVGHIPHTHNQKHTGNLSLAAGRVKFGWIEGVFIRCVLNIWGVMLFLRLSWVVAQSGIALSALVIILATSVTVITTISMCAICTNGEVRGGGTYFMISRSLGPEFGGSIGVIFSLANAVATAMYTIGFAEALQDLLRRHSLTFFENPVNEVRLIACITVCVLFCVAIVGTAWESKAQMVLMAILLVSILDFLLGTLFPPNDIQRAKGYVGWNLNVMFENMGPDFRDETFFSVFAVFFPSVTGILAGANISGDLKDPSQSIPLGSLLAIGITSLSYLFFAFICGSTVVRDANGVSSDTRNCSMGAEGKCDFGLHNDFQIIELISFFGPLIYGGVFAATLSSALASLVSAPKVFQALCNDKLFPYIEFFGKGFGPSDEPRRAYVLAFVIALLCCFLGELNLVAPIISNFFLCAYSLINFSVFNASIAKSPGFRPSFKYYNKWVSLVGAAFSLLITFTGHWSVALSTFALVLTLYLYVMYRKPDVNWGSSTQAQCYLRALSSVQKLNSIPFHVKNYRPQLLVLTGSPIDRPALVDFGHAVVRKSGLMICANILDVKITERSRENLTEAAEEFLSRRKVKAFFELSDNNEFSFGVRCLAQSVGIGKLRPNVVLMGYKSDWSQSDVTQVNQYFEAIHHVFDQSLALAILRVKDGFDLSSFGDVSSLVEFSRKRSFGVINKSFEVSSPDLTRDSFSPQLNAIIRANVFRTPQQSTIDVWWLWDDGGLTLLVPYLLSRRKKWSECSLRVFALADNDSQVSQEKSQWIHLLSKFRINFSDITIVTDAKRPPRQESREAFDKIINKWVKDNPKDGVSVTPAELMANQEKTNRTLRFRELLEEHSRNASLVVMTLPMPRKGICSAALYLSWLEVLTKDFPPFLLVRGNQQDVLTFYS